MQIVSLGALTRQRSDSEMIVNAALCACWQGSARRLKRQVDLPVWGRRSENGTSLRLVVSNLGTFAVSPLWQELRVPPIGFWGVFSALYQTCRLLSRVPRLQLRKVGGRRDAGGSWLTGLGLGGPLGERGGWGGLWWLHWLVLLLQFSPGWSQTVRRRESSPCIIH